MRPPVPRRDRRLTVAAAVPLALAGAAAAAQQAAPLPAVQVNATRLDIPPFDLPAALSVVSAAPADAGLPGVNLSEVLTGVPGILARDRQNYAQDEQLSIRGFGARATFGVRGIRLYVDGVPATLPDGQGQVSHFNLDAAERVEVLRGPFSVLYGNAAGGVVQLWSAPGTATPQTVLGVDGGSHDSFRYSVDTRGTAGALDYNVAAAQFLAGGYRAHSRVDRRSAHARLGFDPGRGRQLVLVLDGFDQLRAQDPLGLTAAQVRADPRQADPAAIRFDTRKSTRQGQAGLVYAWRPEQADEMRAMVYYGQRRIEQYQSIPVVTQADPLQSGGVVAPATNYGGVDARWTHRGELAARAYEFVLGLGGDYQRQRRLGYENFLGDALGVRGRLRRDENDNAADVDAYAQWYWRVAPRWTLLLGLRCDAVRFAEHDFYVTPANPDDSGHVRYAATTPVAGVQFRPADALRFYVSYGRGFETPGYNELGYRSDGRPGLAFDLRPARSRHYEAGVKWRASRALELDAAAFRADTRDELAVASSLDGRTTYRNVGATRRQGVELSLDGELAPRWRLAAAYTHLDARFGRGFLACTGTPCATAATPIRAGTRLPGVPADYGSLRLAHGGALGWREGLTLSATGATTANDAGTARAAGYALLGLDAAYVLALGEGARLQLSARVDNLADCRYIGSVIVNDGSGRYFEPGPGRSWMLGARLAF